MGYLIAYLLLALSVDLIRQLFAPRPDSRVVHRRLWTDSHYDCCSHLVPTSPSSRRQRR